ncbi:SDR family NAD(P)-dependent oxidoreductase [Pseudoruegeria sp. SHC-113]|uniref:SDR family NAD(P)-dependent oxidoreductase n=1 Tax=Pseudoruegeria sp. SHC-113 TaxID=2855439 RepID=UPI0021BAD778|nr:SDR family oxidoreductase [Pseudoruegeria sp. SHC-113]MCT8159950.1 SDR family oxidoreductase [Pseudoruegeria sp. SHC-113]
MTLSGKHIIVTGAGAGIGLGIARQVRAAGAQVSAFDLRSEGAGRLAEIGAEFTQVDVADGDAFEAAILAAHARAGRLDGIVNNAGVTIKVPFLEMSRAQMETLWTVNQRSVLIGSQVAGRLMVAQGQGGAIVNIASNHARCTNPGHEGYAGTKGAIVAMTRAMAWSLGPHGIRANTLSPGMTQTEIVIEAMKDPANAANFRSWGADNEVNTVEEIGNAAVFLLSPASSALNGADLVADRAMSALLGVKDTRK